MYGTCSAICLIAHGFLVPVVVRKEKTSHFNAFLPRHHRRLLKRTPKNPMTFVMSERL